VSKYKKLFLIKYMMENKNKINKCLKSYLIGKKYFNVDEDKSFEYFKQCIYLLNDIKENKIELNNEIINIIDETETECSKFLTQAIETTIEKPLYKCINNKSQEDTDIMFNLIETGNLEQLKKYRYGEIDFTNRNSDGVTALHLAIKYGDTNFLKQSFKLGGLIDQTNNYGHTLLEFACLEKDPNIINFLMKYGADMKKHLLFREGKKYFNNGNQIDILLLEKIILASIFLSEDENKIKHLEFVFNYIDYNDVLSIELADDTNSTQSGGKIYVKNLIKKLDTLIDQFDIDSRTTYITILKEELSYDLSFKMCCPKSKIEILLYNLVPFINYGETLKMNWLISLEVKFMILKILKKKVKINTKELKIELTESLYNSYLKSEIIPEGLLQIIVLQWISKIKV
jgi:hypothetical protein